MMTSILLVNNEPLLFCLNSNVSCCAGGKHTAGVITALLNLRREPVQMWNLYWWDMGRQWGESNESDVSGSIRISPTPAAWLQILSFSPNSRGGLDRNCWFYLLSCQFHIEQLNRASYTLHISSLEEEYPFSALLNSFQLWRFGFAVHQISQFKSTLFGGERET